MEIRELRMGNWVEKFTVLGDSLGFCKVEAKDFFAMSNHPEWQKPITITEEILLKCGFKNEHDEIDGVYYDIYYIPNTDYVVEYKLKAKQYLFCFDSSSGIGVEIKHLHHLQNLFHSLTGKELEVKL